MTREERAAQIWSLLTMAAQHRIVLTYEILGRHIGVPRQGLGQLLEPIQSYCIISSLPPLSSLVVSEVSGLPGEGFIAASDVPKAQAEVFARDWVAAPPPDPDALKRAVQRLPSNGRSLEELKSQIRAG